MCRHSQTVGILSTFCRISRYWGHWDCCQILGLIYISWVPGFDISPMHTCFLNSVWLFFISSALRPVADDLRQTHDLHIFRSGDVRSEGIATVTDLITFSPLYGRCQHSAVRPTHQTNKIVKGCPEVLPDFTSLSHMHICIFRICSDLFRLAVRLDFYLVPNLI